MTTSDRYAARLILPMDGPPIENGVLEIEGETISTVFSGHDADAVQLGNVLVLPGLVNAHAHLEFSHLSTPLSPENGFAGWIRKLITCRNSHDDGLDSIGMGLEEARSTGTSLLGEISTTDVVPPALPPEGPTCVVFHETIGLATSTRATQLASARTFLQQPASPLTHLGLSPHAPYTVHPDLYQDLVALAADRRVPLAIHLAETREELQLLATGDGPLRDLLVELGAWQDGVLAKGSRPLDYLEPLATLDHALVVHGNYLAEAELDWLATHRKVALAFCPRTHFHFGHAAHPWPRLLNAGTTVCLGTDSRASNPDLSLWNEIRFLAREKLDSDPLTLLQMATVNGARALGLSAEQGTLTPGSRADALAISIPENEPCSLRTILLHGTPIGMIRAGHWHSLPPS